MNILHVLSQFEVTGAETYAATVANHQIRLGHRVTIVSDTFHTRTDAELIVALIGERRFAQRVKNIRRLSAIIREKEIDVVHAHSRAASWVAYFSTLLNGIPLVSTIHGRQHVHWSSKAFDIYGDKIIAVCEGIREQLVRDLGLNEKKVVVIRNAIETAMWRKEMSNGTESNKHIVSLVGRLSGPKGDVAKKVLAMTLSEILAKYPQAEFHVIGGMREAEKFHDSLSNDELVRNRVTFSGHKDNIAEIYRRSSVVIGSGRVAMEALASGTQVVAVGESNYVGLISDATKELALRTNFGDAGELADISREEILRDICKAIEGKTADDWPKQFIQQEYEAEDVTQKILFTYAEATAVKHGVNEIPVLMYHRVTDTIPANTKFGIYVTTAELEKQLAYLKHNNFSAMTFFDIKSIIRGEKKLPGKPVILTFDDGYEDNYLHLFPLLKKYSMRAVIFLIGNPEIRTNVWDRFSGEPEANLLRDNQVLEMREYGIEFGSHAMNHRKLTEISPAEAKEELVRSKSQIESRIGSEVLSFAYPYGAQSDTIRKTVRNAGYSFGIATDSGTRNFWSDVYQIRRIPVFPNTSTFSFWKKTSGWYHRYKGVE